jgi:hypothetical protein
MQLCLCAQQCRRFKVPSLTTCTDMGLAFAHVHQNSPELLSQLMIAEHDVCLAEPYPILSTVIGTEQGFGCREKSQSHTPVHSVHAVQVQIAELHGWWWFDV